MSTQLDIQVKPRKITTNGDLKSSKKEGQIPCVVYGKNLETKLGFVDRKNLMTQLYSSLNEHIIFNLKFEKEKEKFVTIIREKVWDPIKQEIIHVDFQKIDLDKEIEMSTEFRYNGIAKGVKQGGVMEIRVVKSKGKALPLDYPKFIDCDVTNLGIGDTLKLKDISIPNSLKLQISPEEVLVTVSVPKAERGQAEPAKAATPAAATATATPAAPAAKTPAKK